MTDSNYPSGPSSLRVQQSDTAEQCGSVPCPAVPQPDQPSGSGTPNHPQSKQQNSGSSKAQDQNIDLLSVGSWASGTDSVDRSKELENCMVLRCVH